MRRPRHNTARWSQPPIAHSVCREALGWSCVSSAVAQLLSVRRPHRRYQHRKNHSDERSGLRRSFEPSIRRFMNSPRYGLLSVMLATLVLFTIGCGTVSPATDRTFVDRINQEIRKRDIVVDSQKLTVKQQIYVVQSRHKERGFLKEIERNLNGRGFIVTSGPMEGLGEQSEFYLVYEDRWSWDIYMYPNRVKMAIYDTRTHDLLGLAEFKNSVYHTYAHPPEITDELLGRIFGESEGQNMK